ncbi:MAG: hypothetical protein ACYC1M_14125 [Armatimonadota bacterium]
MSVSPISYEVGSVEQPTKVLREWPCPGGKKALHFIENADGEGGKLYLIVFHFPANCAKKPVTLASGQTEAEALENEVIYLKNQTKDYSERRAQEIQRREQDEALGHPKRALGARKSS